MIRRWWMIKLLVAVMAFTSPVLASLNIQFSEENFIPSKGIINRVATLQNQGKTPLAYQLSVIKRDIDSEGNETNSGPVDDFLVHPSQLVLMPREQKAVTIIWTGPDEIQIEKAYRLSISQVSIGDDLVLDATNKNKKATVNVNVLMRYLKSIYVLPEKGSPDVIVKSIQYKPQTAELDIVILNQGKVHQLVDIDHLLIISTDKPKNPVKVVLKPEDKSFQLLANGNRKLTIKCPEGLSKKGTLSAELKTVKR